jgi:DNA gyrase subunit A
MAVLGGSTKEAVIFFTNFGSAYVCRILDIPATTGYGEPLQKLFKFDDGEQVVAALSLDPRLRPPASPSGEAILLAVTKGGLGLRFGLAAHSEVSTRAGRLFAKPPTGDQILGVRVADDHSRLTVASLSGRALACPAHEVPLLSGPGKGVYLLKLQPDDQIIGFAVGDSLKVESDKGVLFDLAKVELTGRGGKGRELLKKGKLVRVIPLPLVLPNLGSGRPPGGGDGGGGSSGSGGSSERVSGLSSAASSSSDGSFGEGNGPLFGNRS